MFSGFLYFMTFFFSLLNLVLYLSHLSFSTVMLNLGIWFTSESLNILWSFSFDSLSNLMLILVCSVSTIVIFYSFNYMENDPNMSKFLSYISLFTFFMMILVVSSNLCILLAGWEGVGICSFLLMSFWNLSTSACKAAIKAMVFNSFGDIGFLIGISFIFFLMGSLDFFFMYSFLPFFSYSFFMNMNGFSLYALDIMIFFIFLGVMGKSSQMGLHVWLLDAMEGPTPVSALIHAATMVTAGVYLLISLSFILEYTYSMRMLIVIMGMTTAIFASVIGSFQNDLKSMIAYSTCSQLGYMVSMCGLSGYSIAFFHLMNHGFFKALLFLSSGVIMHNFLDEQDISKMGGLF